MKIAFLVVLLGVFLLPASIAMAGHGAPASTYELGPALDQTIPLWGPTWGKSEVTVIIKANGGVSQAAIDKIVQSVDDSNAAIHKKFGDATPFYLNLITDGKADITIRPKGGGGQIAGTAQQSSEGGIFTGCKISISGKAFGESNDDDIILSIALQELWHCLGLLHSNNPLDMMYGTLQATPNIVISECDVQAFELVMHWLLDSDDAPNTSVHAPHGTAGVVCGTGGPGGGGGGGAVTGDLTVAVAIDPAGPFGNRDRVHILATVSDDIGGVAGAVVEVTIVTPNPDKDVGGTFLTDDSGQIHVHYRVNAGRDGTGIYHVLTEAAKDSAVSATCSHIDDPSILCHEDFVVN